MISPLGFLLLLCSIHLRGDEAVVFLNQCPVVSKGRSLACFGLSVFQSGECLHDVFVIDLISRSGTITSHFCLTPFYYETQSSRSKEGSGANPVASSIN